MKQRIFSHLQDYLIQYISHQYQDLLYCNSSQYILSTYNSQHNNNNNKNVVTDVVSSNLDQDEVYHNYYNNVVLAMTMPI
jgi:aerobic-type carbon monoxide dehydrogenase small subunit (CoxS/CutS family)